MLIWGKGMDTMSLPLRPISSPLETYFLRFCLIFPRTMSRKRRWSGSMRRAMSDHQVAEALALGVVDAQAPALAFRCQGGVQDPQGAGEDRHVVRRVQVLHQLEQELGGGAIDLDGYGRGTSIHCGLWGVACGGGLPVNPSRPLWRRCWPRS